MLTEIFTAEHFTYYLIAVNFIAFAMFGFDKALAEAGASRVSESALLSWALFGGTPGAYAGRQLFRHKTRKQPFSNQLHVIAALHVAILVAVTAVGWGTVGTAIVKIVS